MNGEMVLSGGSRFDFARCRRVRKVPLDADDSVALRRPLRFSANRQHPAQRQPYRLFLLLYSYPFLGSM